MKRMTLTHLSRAVVLALAALLAAPAVLAQTGTFSYPNFGDASALQINYNAATVSSGGQNVLRVVPSAQSQRGSAFTKAPIALSDESSFSTAFSFRFSNQGGGGADGIVFVVQTVSNSAGSVGGGIGYAGIENSVGVEFDSWNNEHDGDESHVGINIGGEIASVVEESTLGSLGDLDDGQVWYAWVDYNGQTDRLEVRLAKSNDRPADPFLSHTVDLLSELGSDAQGNPKPAYVGFTSATGAATAHHDVLTWAFENEYDPIETVEPEAPVVAAGCTVGIPELPRANSWGDVHIRTPDGLKYDFQATGEFVLAMSTDGAVVVQTRQEAWPRRPRVSVNTAAAMSVAGDRVGVYLNGPDQLVINGEARELGSGQIGLPNGGCVARVEDRKGRTVYHVVWPDGFNTAVTVNGTKYLNVGVSTGASRRTYVGLVGSPDGNTANDLTLRTGETIAAPASFADVHQRFGASWRVAASESLFRYASGTSSQTVNAGAMPDQPFTIDDLGEDERARARAACEGAGIRVPEVLNDCILDVGATGDTAFIVSAETVAQSVTESGRPVVEAVASAGSGSFRLGEGERTCSANGAYCLALQEDGNVVLYAARENNRFVWGSYNQLGVALGRGPQHLEMENGALRLVRNGAVVWSTETGGTQEARLVVTDGGDVEIRTGSGSVVWSALEATPGPVTVGTVLRAGEELAKNEQLCSPNGGHCLIFQNEGNLVVYRPADGGFVWGLNQTGTDFTRNARVAMGTDGNLVAYAASGGSTWATGTQGNAGATLELRDSGEMVVVYGGRVVWSSASGLASASAGGSASGSGGGSGGGSSAGAAAVGQLALPQSAIAQCRAGLVMLLENEYTYASGASTDAWEEVYTDFKENHLAACDAVGVFLNENEGHAALSGVRAILTADERGAASWEDYFYKGGLLGIVFHGDRIGPYCPAQHLRQYDCVQGRERVSEFSIRQGALRILDALSGRSDASGAGETITVAGTELRTGPIQVTLEWAGLKDLDVFVTDPSNAEVGYNNKRIGSGGFLDVDARASCPQGGSPSTQNVENIAWEGTPPDGTYTIRVNHYRPCGQDGSSPYTLTLRHNGQVVQTWNGDLSEGDADDRHTFSTRDGVVNVAD